MNIHRHIHGGQFQVLGREVLPELRAGWEGVKDGNIEHEDAGMMRNYHVE